MPTYIDESYDQYTSFAAFLMRAADQIRIAGIGGNPIKVVGSHSGCSIG